MSNAKGREMKNLIAHGVMQPDIPAYRNGIIIYTAIRSGKVTKD